MYSVADVPLDNPTLGWVFRLPSKPLSSLVRRVASINLPGLPGVATVPGDVDAPVITMVVQTSQAQLGTLYALMLRTPNGQPNYLTITSDPSRRVVFEFMSASLAELGDGTVDASFLLRLNDVYWRDTALTTSAPVLLANPFNLIAFDGLSAPIEDALVRITGPCASVTVTNYEDNNGFTYAVPLATGFALVYDVRTQHARLLAAGAWFGGVDVSGSMQFFGSKFRLTPYMPGPDPRVRQVRLTGYANSFYGGAKIEVQARRAYVV